jgi:pentatricopeptide repeat protein
VQLSQRQPRADAAISAACHLQATYAAVINAHAAAGDIGAAEQLLEQLLSSTSDVNLLLGASRSSSSSSSDSSANRNGNSSSDSASSMQAGQVGQAAFTAAGLQAAAGGPLLFDAAAGSNGSTSGSNGRSEQLQQGLGSLAGGTRNSRHVLRHQYNSLIKGWLRLAADAHAAANSAAPGQQWLPAADAAGSNGGSRTSSSWNGALQAAEVQRGRAGLLQQMPRAPPPPVQQQLQQPAAATRAAPGYSGAAAAAAAVTAPVGAASSERSPAAARPASRSALLQSMPALIRPVLPPQPQAAVVQVQPAHATAAPNGTAGAVHSGSSSSSVAPVVVVSRQAATFGEALAVLQRMQAAGVAPAADTYTLFIHYCIKVGCWCGT